MCPPAGMGSVPEVHIKGTEDGGVCVVCSASEWYPKPQVQWRDSRGENLPASSETHTEDAAGLFSMESTLVVRDRSLGSVTCSTFNPILGQEKAMAMFIPGEGCSSLLQSSGSRWPFWSVLGWLSSGVPLTGSLPGPQSPSSLRLLPGCQLLP